MAFSYVAHRGGTSNKTSSATLAVSPSANLAVNRIVVVRCSTDSVASPNNNNHSLADSQGNTWTKLGEIGVSGQSTTSLWISKISTQIGTGNTITLTVTSAVTARAMAIEEFQLSDTSKSVAREGSAATASGAGTAIGTSLSGFASQEYLWLAAVGIEKTTDAYTQDADYAGDTRYNTTGGGAASNIATHFGYRIATLTGDTYGATNGAGRDWTMVYAAVEEVSTGYTLAADAGSVAITGTAADLEYHREVQADPGSVAITGTDATLVYAKTLIADPGAVAITGTAADLEYNRLVTADPGSVAIAGTDAALLYARVMPADPGAVAITGTAADLRYGKNLVADPGAVDITGTAADLRYDRRLDAGAGAVAITGTDATLTYGSVWYAGYEDSIFLDFVNDRYWDGAEYSGAATWISGSASTFTRASIGYDMEATAEFAVDEMRVTAAGLTYEPGATNLLLHSNDITNAAWVKFVNTTVTANQGEAPDGTTTADRLQMPASSGTTLYQGPTFVGGSTYTISGWIRGTSGTSHFAWHINGTHQASPSGGYAPGTTRQRYSGTAAATAGTNWGLDNFNNATATDILVSFLQLELGSAPSSYIPSGASNGVRSADALTIALPAGTHDLTVTFDDDTTQVLTGVSGNYALPTTLNRAVIKTITGELQAAVFTLTADPGSVAVSGTAADLEYNRLVAAEAGSVSIAGTDATLVYAKTVIADPGAVVITGTDADLLYARELAADAGTVDITGTDAGLLYARIMPVDAGAYAITGTDATLVYAKTVIADPGAIDITGTAADLYYDRLVTADPGAVTVTGTAADLEHHRLVLADPGSVVITGTDADLRVALVLTAEAGSVALTGEDANLEWHHVLVAEAGAVDITGTDATLTYLPVGAFLLTADAGAIDITGTDANLEHHRLVSAEAGAVTIDGTDATLTYTPVGAFTLVADPGAFTITGTPADLIYTPLAAPAAAGGGGSYAGYARSRKRRRLRRVFSWELERLQAEAFLAVNESTASPVAVIESAVDERQGSLARLGEELAALAAEVDQAREARQRRFEAARAELERLRAGEARRAEVAAAVDRARARRAEIEARIAAEMEDEEDILMLLFA